MKIYHIFDGEESHYISADSMVEAVEICLRDCCGEDAADDGGFGVTELKISLVTNSEYILVEDDDGYKKSLYEMALEDPRPGVIASTIV